MVKPFYTIGSERITSLLASKKALSLLCQLIKNHLVKKSSPSILEAALLLMHSQFVLTNKRLQLLKMVSLSSTQQMTGQSKLVRGSRLPRVREEFPLWVSLRMDQFWVWQLKMVTSLDFWHKSPQFVQQMRTLPPFCHLWQRSQWLTAQETTW